MPHISIQAEYIGSIFGLPVTNSILTTWVVMGILIIGGVLLSRNMQLVPKRGQNFLEIIIESLYDLFEGITGASVKKFFSLLATLFIFIILGNWIGLVPGVGSIGIKETVVEETARTSTGHEAEQQQETTKLVPLFRGATADLNTTLALAIITILAIQYYSIKDLGFKTHIAKYLNFSNPINFFVGILEILSEFSRMISFAFRLFGNIFAGEVLLTIIAFLVPVIAPLPFLALEVFVGFIQALVFAMLTAVLLNVATQHGEH